MLVLKMLGHGFGLFRLDLFGRGVQGIVRFAAFGCATHVSCRVRERDARLRHPDKFDRLLRRDRKLQRFGVSKTNVFTCENHNPPRDKTEIFPGVQHFRQQVHRAFFIRSAHAFDKRADGVVVGVAVAIVNDGLLLDAFLGNCEREVNHRFVVAGGVDPGGFSAATRAAVNASGYNCFANPVRADVMMDGHKVAGAAQRRTRRGLLQQGSIQGFAMKTDLAQKFAQALSANCSEFEANEEIFRRAREVAQQKYGTEPWQRRR